MTHWQFVVWKSNCSKISCKDRYRACSTTGLRVLPHRAVSVGSSGTLLVVLSKEVSLKAPHFPCIPGRGFVHVSCSLRAPSGIGRGGRPSEGCGRGSGSGAARGRGVDKAQDDVETRVLRVVCVVTRQGPSLAHGDPGSLARQTH